MTTVAGQPLVRISTALGEIRIGIEQDKDVAARMMSPVGTGLFEDLNRSGKIGEGGVSLRGTHTRRWEIICSKVVAVRSKDSATGTPDENALLKLVRHALDRSKRPILFQRLDVNERKPSTDYLA
jgi:hypothetical protein